MTLGTWFREYLYIPLGGNRRGKAKLVRNMAIVWLCTGLWHGASWNFVLWGAYFGVLIICERLFLQKWMEKWPSFCRHLYTMLLVVVSWVFFSIESLPKAFSYLDAMFGGAPLWDTLGLYSLYTRLPLLILLAVCATPLMSRFLQKLKETNRATRILWSVLFAVAFFVSIAYLVDATYNPFLYFRF